MTQVSQEVTSPAAALGRADKRLIRELQSIVGRQHVLHEPGDLVAFEYDGTIERALPTVVVLPDGAREVAAVVRTASAFGIPVIPRGAGTGLSGGAVAESGGVVVVLTRMKRILELDAVNRLAVVEPGVVNLDLSEAAAPLGLRFAPDPSSQRACTIGGNVAENAGGPHCLAHGVTTNHVLGLELVLAGGEILWVGGRGTERPGYDLTRAVVGSEGTLAIVTKAVVRLMPLPEAAGTLLAAFDKMNQASRAVSAIIGHGIVPVALEMMDREVIGAVEAAMSVGYPLDAEAALLIEVEGLQEEVGEQTEAIRQICLGHKAREVRVAADAAEREGLWAGRKGAFGALGRLAPNFYVLDGVVPRTRLPQVLRGVAAAGKRRGLRIANVFHAGDGNLHPNLLFDGDTPGATGLVLEAGAEIMRLCVEAGGSVTGEHGVGMEKRRFMSWVFSETDLDYMARLKTAFDAGSLFNPGKVFPSAGGHGEADERKMVVGSDSDAHT